MLNEFDTLRNDSVKEIEAAIKNLELCRQYLTHVTSNNLEMGGLLEIRTLAPMATEATRLYLKLIEAEVVVPDAPVAVIAVMEVL